MADQNFDVVVIGAGPGGYVAAIRAAQLGFNTACIDRRGPPGGTCLNVGCIPSKALLQSSHHFEDASKHFADHGVVLGSVKYDLAKMMARKQKVVGDNTKGVEFLFKKNKITYIVGEAKITAPGQLSVGSDKITAKHIIIATGSDVTPLPGVE
ncbi:MAG TPA: FAD-dependent oxidoreductase, partial [Magnetospirillaceae bacterium]|nr:FAD-dependent oxidoreductase [Magnetospirillaceae bacterium]